jgi:hypothetical protein
VEVALAWQSAEAKGLALPFFTSSVETHPPPVRVAVMVTTCPAVASTRAPKLAPMLVACPDHGVLGEPAIATGALQSPVSISLESHDRAVQPEVDTVRLTQAVDPTGRGSQLLPSM